MMILFDSNARVKLARKPFAAGLAEELVRRGRFEPSDADRAWATYELNKDSKDYFVLEEPTPSDAELEDAAGCAQAQARLDAGFAGFF